MQGTDIMRAELVYSLDLEDILVLFKRARTERNIGKQSYEFYNACLDRINNLVTERNSKVKKDQIIQILNEMSYYRPKEDEIYEKQRKHQGLMTKSEMQDDIISVRHKEIISEKADSFRTVPGDMAKFVFQNLSKGLFKDMFTQYDEEQESKFKVSLYDVLSNYIELYQNLEVRVNDMLNQDNITLTPKEGLDVLVSYSIAQEGTNTLFVKLIELLLKRQEPYDIVEIELVLNYFPHVIWRNEQQLMILRDRFYYPMTLKINEIINDLDSRQFLSVFQGLSLCGDQVFKLELFNKYLNSYVQRIQAATNKLNVEQCFTFLELYIQYMRANPSLLEIIDSHQLIQVSNQLVFNNELPKLTIHQISGLFWIFSNIGGSASFNQVTVDIAEERLSKLMREELLLQKNLEKDVEANVREGLQTMSVHDLEVIDYLYNNDINLKEVSKRSKEIQKLIKQAKHWDKPEKERKWFHI
ncbi:UNKNOWN [Stylonychia lemnae]|uniref:Uncharacterized protein n=1 Tax=Stylonychia lemnae TaxID=5949 RepID=A0A077ZXP5_STYLE|nr:UNKNOWN [Stylonychia lemnae]|eukprot:CDW74326.1 UNKNOWN [Stylonychia lemnae]